MLNSIPIHYNGKTRGQQIGFDWSGIKREKHIDFDWSGKQRVNHIDFYWSGKKRGTNRKNHEKHGTEKRGQRESNEGPQSWGPKRLEILPTELKGVDKLQYTIMEKREEIKSALTGLE